MISRLRIMESNILGGLLAGIAIGIAECIIVEIRTRAKAAELIEEATAPDAGKPVE